MRWTNVAGFVVSLVNRTLALFRHPSVEADVTEELRFHREQLMRDTRPDSTSMDAARAAAIRLGNNRRLAEDARDAWRFPVLSHLGRDLRFAARQLRRAWVTSAVAILSLALGVGLNAGISDVLYDVLLHRLPVRDPGALRVIGTPESDGSTSTFFPLPLLDRLRSEVQGFSGVAASVNIRYVGIERQGSRSMAPNGATLVSGNYFGVLGVSPALGRTLLPSDDSPTVGAQVGVLSHAFWMSHFGGDSAVIGTSVRVNGHPFDVVGVAPPSFTGVSPGRTPDMWFPITTDHLLLHRSPDWRRERTNWWVQFFGRVRPGVTDDELTGDLSQVLRQFALELEGDELGEERRRDIERTVLTVRDGATGMPLLAEAYGRPLRLLFALSGVVLMLACLNVTGLQVGRLHARRRELGVRRALGASAGRVAGHVMAEGALIALSGAVLGLAANAAAGGLLRRWLLPLTGNLSFSNGGWTWLLAMSGGGAVVLALVIGGLPTLLVRHGRLSGLTGTRGDGESAPPSALRWLTSAQFALAIPLVVCALLLARSLSALHQVPLGYDREGVATVVVDATRNNYSAARRVATYRAVIDAVAEQPGVRSVSATMFAPLSGSRSSNSFRFEGLADDGRTNFAVMYVDPGYFRTLGMPVRAGREFARSDDPRRRGVAVLSEALATRLFGSPGQAIGRRMTRSEDGPFDVEIVGVAPDARVHDVRGDAPETVYQPFLADSGNVTGATLVVATTAPRSERSALVREAIGRADPALEVLLVGSIDDNLARLVTTEDSLARLTSVFGGLALLLSALGLYAAFALEVGRRMHEFGVRLALGAHPAQLQRAVVGRALRVLGVGAVVGGPLAWASVVAVRSLLFGVHPADAGVLALAALVFGAAAVLAAWIPAARAGHVDPVRTLRGD